MPFIKELRAHHPIEILSDAENSAVLIVDHFDCNWTGAPTIVVDVEQIDALIEALQKAKQDVLDEMVKD